MALTDTEKKAVQDALYYQAPQTGGAMIPSGETKGSYQFKEGAGKGLETGLSLALSGAGLGASIGSVAGPGGTAIGAAAGAGIGAGVGLVGGFLGGGFKGYMDAGKEYDQARKLQRAQEKEARRQKADAQAYGRRSASKRAEGMERAYLSASPPPEMDVTAGPGISSYDAFKAKTYGG